ncbi:MAG TPA: hypothetical protein VGC79_25125 [Polyangiaceae bacterium]
MILPAGYLETKRQTGLDVKLLGYNNDSLVVKVSPEYVSEFLQGFDSSVAGLPPAAPAPSSAPSAIPQPK